jgi:RNA polymerase sigma factor (sigma-70 family)
VLLQEAAAGSGAAFAALYDRYESRVFNFCLRVVDSREDAGDATQEAFLSVLRRVQSNDDPVLNFSAYLFTAARHEAFKVSERRARTDLVAEAPERGDPTAGPPAIETDPERSALLQSSQQEVRAANARLPRRHREVLALRELVGCSYEEIAQILGTNRNAVSQLIWRARANLRDELRVAAVSSVAAASEACERAQTLISQQEDGELDEFDRAWLERHLEECGACRTSKAALLEVGASYRAWLPVAAIAGMRPDVLTRGGEIVGADWSGVASLGSTSAGPGAATAQFAARLGVAAAAGAAALALAGLFQDGERRRPAAARTPPVISHQASKPEAAEGRARGGAVEAARRAARRQEGKVLPAKWVTAPPGARTGPPQRTAPRPGRPPVEPPASPPDAVPRGPEAPSTEPPASPPDAVPRGPEAPSAEPPASPPDAVPRGPEVGVTPDTPSTPVQAPEAPNCSQPSQGRGPDGCPPGHGGEPPARMGEGGRGPPVDPPGQSLSGRDG